MPQPTLTHLSHTQQLLSDWVELGASLGQADAGWLQEGQRLLRHWNRWPRAYHTTRHLKACLHHWQQLQQENPHALAHPPAAALALWFHDAVYWPWSHHNEQRSADWAVRFLQSRHLPASTIDLVVSHILATRHQHGALTGDAAWVVDIDLTILASPETTYLTFERHVRQEYWFVPAERYRRGRTAVLQSFMDRPSIYQTAWFSSRMESAARDNLQQAIHSLQAGVIPGLKNTSSP